MSYVKIKIDGAEKVKKFVTISKRKTDKLQAYPNSMLREKNGKVKSDKQVKKITSQNKRGPN